MSNEYPPPYPNNPYPPQQQHFPYQPPPVPPMYHPYSPYPPQQPKKQGLSTRSLVAIVLVPLSVILVCSVLLLVTQGHILLPTSVAGSSATLTTRPTATSPTGPQPIFAPVLGGTLGDFTEQYGTPSDTGDSTGGIWPHTLIAGQPVSLVVSVDESQGSRDGQLHVMQLSVQSPPGTTWSSRVQQRLLAVFLPADARFQHLQSTPSGIERIYSSAQLAATFSASLFTNDAGTQRVAPGTLFEMCFHGTSPVPTGGVADTCTISIGVN